MNAQEVYTNWILTTGRTVPNEDTFCARARSPSRAANIGGYSYTIHPLFIFNIESKQNLTKCAASTLLKTRKDLRRVQAQLLASPDLGIFPKLVQAGACAQAQHSQQVYQSRRLRPHPLSKLPHGLSAPAIIQTQPQRYTVTEMHAHADRAAHQHGKERERRLLSSPTATSCERIRLEQCMRER